MTLRRWRKKEWAFVWGGYVRSSSMSSYNTAQLMTTVIPNAWYYSIIQSVLSDEKSRSPIDTPTIMQSTVCDVETPTLVSSSTLSENTNIATPITVSGLAVTQTLVSS